MKGLFDTLLNKIRPIVSARPRVLAAHFPPNGLLYHYSQYNLLESSTLHIDAGQVAYLIINEQYTPAYREGEYPLDPDNIPPTSSSSTPLPSPTASGKAPTSPHSVRWISRFPAHTASAFMMPMPSAAPSSNTRPSTWMTNSSTNG